MGIEWTETAVEHMWDRHQINSHEASEAFYDIDALIYDPDPMSKSGRSVRVVGYSRARRQVLCVIVLRGEGDDWVGVNAWPANSTYRRNYEEGTR